MLKGTYPKVLVFALAAVLVILLSVSVLSQQQGPPYPMEGGNQPGPPMQGPMGPGMMQQNQQGGMGMPMMQRMGGSAAVAATADYVYVVQGSTLYQFSAKTLKMENKAELTTSTTRSQPATK